MRKTDYRPSRIIFLLCCGVVLRVVVADAGAGAGADADNYLHTRDENSGGACIERVEGGLRTLGGAGQHRDGREKATGESLSLWN